MHRPAIRDLRSPAIQPLPAAPTRSEPASTPSAARSSADAWRGLLLIALTLLAYSPALFGQYLWDDDAHVTRTALRSFDGLRRIWTELGATQQYYPLLHSAFWVQAQLWGDSVLGYHLANVTLHAIAALLLVTLCQRLQIRGAWIAGFIFALHPVNVESVAWISEQKNTLSLVFYLLAAIAYVRFDAARRRRDYAVASALFVCALLTKTVTASLPATLLVLFWWKRGRIQWRRDVVPLLPWFVAAATSGLFTAWVEQHLIGAAGPEYSLDALQRALLAGRVIWFYLWKLFWPSTLMFTYPHWTVDASAGWQWEFDLAFAALVFACWRLRGRTRAPLAGLLFFAGSLFPVLGFLNIYPFRYSYVADHFVYLASLGVIVPLSGGIATVIARASGLRRRYEGRIWVASLVALLGARSYLQSTIYRDPVTLYRATIALNPDDWMAHQNLGIIYARGAVHRANAIREFETVIALKPDHDRAHYLLGVALYLSGRGPEAVAQFESAIRYAPGNTLIAGNSHYFIGVIFSAMPGRLDDAIAQLREAVRLKPNDPEARDALAAALKTKERQPARR